MSDLPIEPVRGEAHMQLHPAGPVVATEDPGKAVLERDDGAVEYAVGLWYQVPAYDGVVGVAP